jgi:4-amino-4-deoxy-L-arabinose transferase-like glycosyltransferase
MPESDPPSSASVEPSAPTATATETETQATRSGESTGSEAKAPPPADARSSASDEAPAKVEAPASPVADAPAPVVREPPRPEQPPTVWPSWLPLTVAVVFPALLFLVLPPLTRSGLWDPYELNVADLARRVGLNTLGAAHLALDGADNSLPHLNDLGRPQLPFTLIAIGFKFFELHEWAGRLPLALCGVLGVVATYLWVARLFDKRTGVYAAIILSTLPLYFVQARSMLGDICAMAGLAMAFGGLAVAAFDRDDDGPTSLGARLPWLLMAAVGLAAGFETRGGLLGLAVPFGGVGLAWGVSRLSAPSREPDPIGDVVGGLSFIAAVGFSILAARVVAAPGDNKDLSMWVGAMLHVPAKYPTFDFYIAAIGHALAPWSAFLPFAVGRLLIAAPGRTGAAGEREGLSRVAVLVGLTVAFVAHGYLSARTDLVAFTGPALCAVTCAVAIRDFERGAQSSIAIGLGTLLVAAVLHHDFHELPEKAYQAFGVTGATFPDSFKDQALKLWWVVLGGFAITAFLTWIERDAERTPFDPGTYSKVLKTLREAFDGMLALVYFATIAGASLAGLFVFAGMRLHAHWMPQMSSSIRDLVLNAWWVVAFVPLGVILGLLFMADLWLWTFGRSRPLTKASFTRGFEPFEELLTRLRPGQGDPRLAPFDWWVALLALAPFMLLMFPAIGFVAWFSAGFKPYLAALLAVPTGVAFFLAMGIVGDALRHRASGLAVGGAVVGFVLCFFYYPALANQLSPKEVFESYRRVCPGAPLALLGVGGRTAAYYAGGQPQTLNDAQSAYTWLMAGGGQRRCLAMKSEELPKLNQLYREHGPEPRSNLPVLDARSSQILLVSSTLADGEKNESPLSGMVLSAPPKPQRPLDVNMDDKLQVLGIDIVDDRGTKVEAIAPGRPYHLKTYYKVLAPITTEWEAFIHIDGYHRRHNGDHKVMNGKYAMSLWLPGDLVMDDHEFKLEPNFTPGTYTVYFGLFVGDTRLKVKSGPNDGDNRVNGGPLRVQ